MHQHLICLCCSVCEHCVFLTFSSRYVRNMDSFEGCRTSSEYGRLPRIKGEVVVGVATFLLCYLSRLLRSVLVEIGISEDMHNPVCKFHLLLYKYSIFFLSVMYAFQLINLGQCFLDKVLDGHSYATIVLSCIPCIIGYLSNQMKEILTVIMLCTHGIFVQH